MPPRKRRQVNSRPSTGCEGCRKRKVKCDEGKPLCQRCIRRGIDCVYRDQVQIWFHDETQDVIERSREQHDGLIVYGKETKEKPVESKSKSLVLVKKIELIEVELIEAKKRSVQQIFQTIYRISPGDALTRDSVMSLIVRHCYPEKYLSSQKTLYPPARFEMCANLGLYEAQWSPISCAMSALAFTRCYHETGDSNMHRKGLEMYQKALGCIRVALNRRETAFSADTIMGVATMGVYEALEDPTGRKGEAHSSAFVNLVRLMGPEAMQINPLHDIFSICRVHTVVQAVVQSRKRTFFSSPEWCTIPWIGREKNVYHHLVDLTAELCTHLETLDSVPILASEELKIQQRIDLQNDLLRLSHHLLTWLPSCERGYGTTSYMTNEEQELALSRSVIEYSTTAAIFSSGNLSLRFESLEAAEGHLLYWTTSLIVSMSLKDNNDALLELLSESTTPSPSATQTLRDQYMIPNTTILDFSHATAITNTLTYFLSQENGLFGVSPMTGPLYTALKWFKRQSPACGERVGWCQKILVSLPVAMGEKLFKGIRISGKAVRGEGGG